MAKDGGAGNRSAVRSRRMLQEAFSELLGEKPLDKITVSDIVERADVSRSTFYAHYRNTEDLFNSMVSDFIDKLFVLADKASDLNFLKDPGELMELTIGYLKQDGSLYRCVAGTSAANLFVASMKDYLTQRLLEAAPLRDADDDEDDLDFRLGVTCVVGSLVDMCHAWLRGDYGDVAVERIAQGATRIIRSFDVGVFALDA